jgi:hypothetical protein
LIASNLLWADIKNSIRHSETFTELSGPQDIAKALTNIIDIFEQFFGKNVQEIVNETNHYEQQFKKIPGAIFFPNKGK